MLASKTPQPINDARTKVRAASDLTFHLVSIQWTHLRPKSEKKKPPTVMDKNIQLETFEVKKDKMKMPIKIPGNAACERVSPIKLLFLRRTVHPTREEETAMRRVPMRDVRTTGLVKKSITACLMFVFVRARPPHPEGLSFARMF